MKKLLVAAIVAASVLVASGCERQNAPARGLAEGEISALLLTDATGIDDRSFNAAAWQGFLNFYGETWASTPSRGRLYDVLTAATMADYIPNLMMAVEEGYDLIVTAGFTWAEAVTTVATDSPDQNFLIVDVDWIDRPNVMQAIFAEHEGSFLVGAAAALQAIEDGIENPSFGFIGGVAGALITRFHVGFAQGVLYVLPNAELRDHYVNSWGEPALARTQAINWFDDGVFAIFSAAGASGNGTIVEAREQRIRGNNVWAIGVDSDQFFEGVYTGPDGRENSAVLTSMLKRVETSVVYALNAVRGGNFSGRTIRFDLPMDGVGFSTTNPALSAATAAEVDRIRQRIISGEIVVAETLAGARQTPNFPMTLWALDG